jgi:hypothetical protein
MKEFFKNILEDKTITSAFLMNIFFVIAAIGYILLSYGKLPPSIPIFNQMPWGEQRLGGTFTIFIPVLIAILILIINMLTSTSIYKQIPLISRMFAAVSLLIGILTFLFVIRTITSIT